MRGSNDNNKPSDGYPLVRSHAIQDLATVLCSQTSLSNPSTKSNTVNAVVNHPPYDRIIRQQELTRNAANDQARAIG